MKYFLIVKGVLKMTKIYRHEYQEIYDRYYRNRESQKDIAKDFKVSTMAISKVLKKINEEKELQKA